MPHLVFLVEEGSMQAMLQEFLPRILPDGVEFVAIAHQGKQDLKRKLVRKIQHYRKPEARFIVVQDQDRGDCIRVKAELTALCEQAARSDSLVRIVCHELESWYLADLAAVEAALGANGVVRQQQKAKFRNPDRIELPEHELRVMIPTYNKIRDSQAIGRHLDPDNTRSPSFRAFVDGVRRIALP